MGNLQNLKPFKKGEAKGRPPGAVNIITRTIRETFVDVFNQAQTDPKMAKIKLQAFAMKNPKTFYEICSRIIPTEIRVSVPEPIRINYAADPGSLPIGTDPETNFGILGEQSSL